MSRRLVSVQDWSALALIFAFSSEVISSKQSDISVDDQLEGIEALAWKAVASIQPAIFLTPLEFTGRGSGQGDNRK